MTNLKFNKTAVAAAVASAIGFAAPVAQAVNLTADGLGEVLIWPYYTVNNGFDTYLNITNTSAETVALKLRFREAYNSRDVRDFNIILSPYDVWAGTVTRNADGSAARVQTKDKSCTQPELPVIDAATGLHGIDFTNLAYSDDTGPTSLDRTKEGYFYAIEMGTSDVGNENVSGTVAFNAKHVNGVPRNCAAIVTAFENSLQAVQDEFDEPNNVLKGTAVLIKVDAGKAGGFDAVTLANFYNPVEAGGLYPDDAGEADLIARARDVRPNLGDADPPISFVKLDTGPDNGVTGFAINGWANRIDAVTAVLTRQSLMNQFNVEPSVVAETDMVITFPTKYFYVDTAQKGTGPAIPPFAKNFQNDTDGNGVSCDQVGLVVHDREEFQPETSSDFSPPPAAGRNELCYETNVLTFNDGDVLGSPISQNINLAANSIVTGWLDVALDLNEGGTGPTTTRTSLEGTAFVGLPVIGFSMTTLENGVANDNLLNYGAIWNHAYRRALSAD